MLGYILRQQFNITLNPFTIIPQYLHSRLCSLLENNGVVERDWDRQEYWKGRLSDGGLSSLSTSEEAVSLVFEVNIIKTRETQRKVFSSVL